jgi:hypothetical protein
MSRCVCGPAKSRSSCGVLQQKGRSGMAIEVHLGHPAVLEKMQEANQSPLKTRVNAHKA